MAVLRACAVAALACACGTGQGEGGGGENLPTLGAGPFGRLDDPENDTPLREPVLIAESDHDLTDPFVLAEDAGFRVWFSRDGVDIRTARFPSRGERPEEVTVALESGRAPTLHVDDDGSQVLYYETDAGHIGRARSADGGLTFAAEDAPVVKDAIRPGVGRAGGMTFLYYVRDGAIELDGHGPVGLDGTDPQPTVRITATGDLHVGLHYVAGGVVQYAGSRDGVQFTPMGPVLDADDPAEHGPSVLVEPTRALLLFSQPQSDAEDAPSVIAGAEHP